METSIESSLQSIEIEEKQNKQNELTNSEKLIMGEKSYRRWPKGWRNEIKYRILYFSPV